MMLEDQMRTVGMGRGGWVLNMLSGKTLLMDFILGMKERRVRIDCKGFIMTKQKDGVATSLSGEDCE